MSNSENLRDLPPTPQIHEIIKELRSAWRARRAIVPIVGAGLSADSGVPIIRSVVRYFGKFSQFLKKRAYLPTRQQVFGESDPLRDLGERFVREPRLFVEHFGWPDRFQLNQDLLQLLEDDKRDPSFEFGLGTQKHNLVAQSVLHGLRDALKQINRIRPTNTRRGGERAAGPMSSSWDKGW
jgi:hypothetical protein